MNQNYTFRMNLAEFLLAYTDMVNYLTHSLSCFIVIYYYRTKY